MSAPKKLVLIALGYALSAVGGYLLVAVNESLIPADVSQTSGGMVAFGDMIVFVLGTGTLSLVPTWFLLKLWLPRAPRSLVAVLLLVAAIGPLSWLAMIHLAGRGPSSSPEAVDQLLGPLIAFGAIPRIVAGPVLVMIEGVAFVLVEERAMRTVLAVAMLMDIVPIGLYVLRFMMMPHA